MWSVIISPPPVVVVSESEPEPVVTVRSPVDVPSVPVVVEVIASLVASLSPPPVVVAVALAPVVVTLVWAFDVSPDTLDPTVAGPPSPSYAGLTTTHPQAPRSAQRQTTCRRGSTSIFVTST